MTEVAFVEPIQILCFGGLNTWGRKPDAGGQRFNRGERWSGILSAELGPRFHVVEEGLDGRTTIFDDPLAPCRNASTQLAPCLDSHKPLDVVLLMLGTSDLQNHIAAAPETIAAGVARLGTEVLASEAWPGGGSPQLVIIAPPVIAGPQRGSPAPEHAERVSHLLPALLARTASSLGCRYIDSNTAVGESQSGLVLDAESHRRLALALVPLIVDCTKS